MKNTESQYLMIESLGHMKSMLSAKYFKAVFNPMQGAFGPLLHLKMFITGIISQNHTLYFKGDSFEPPQTQSKYSLTSITDRTEQVHNV